MDYDQTQISWHPGGLKDISTLDFSTPSFSPGLFNHELFNHTTPPISQEISDKNARSSKTNVCNPGKLKESSNRFVFMYWLIRPEIRPKWSEDGLGCLCIRGFTKFI